MPIAPFELSETRSSPPIGPTMNPQAGPGEDVGIPGLSKIESMMEYVGPPDEPVDPSKEMMDGMFDPTVMDGIAAAIKAKQATPQALSEEDVEYLLDLCLKDIEAAEDYVEPMRTERNLNYAAYRARAYGNEKPGRSKFVSSDISDTVEWVLPSLLKIFLSGDRALSISGRKAEDIEGSKAMEEIIDWQLMVLNPGFVALYNWFKAALLYPNAYCETGWDKVVKPLKADRLSVQEMYALATRDDIEIYSFDPVYKPVILPEVGTYGGPDYRPREEDRILDHYVDIKYGEVIRDTNTLEVFHPGQFLIGEGEVDIQRANFVGRLYRVPFSYLKEHEKSEENPTGVYTRLDEVEEKLRAGGTDSELDGVDDEASQAAAEYGVSSTEADVGDATPHDIGRTMVPIYKCWVKADPKGQGKGDRYLVEIANGVPIRACLNPYRHGEVPICELRSNIDPFQHFGLCVTGELRQLQKLKTSALRQIIDNLAFQNNAYWLVENGVIIDQTALQNPMPRGVARVGDINRIRKEAPAYYGDKALSFIEYLDTVRENRTGVTRYSQGLDSNSLNKTARGITQIMAASQQRIETIARIFAETGVKDLMRQWISNVQQFISKKTTFRLLNREAVEIDPKQLNFKFDLLVSVGIGTGSKQQQLQDMTLIYQTLMNDPNLAQMGIVTPPNRYNLVESWLQTIGRQDTARFISPPSPQQPVPQAPPPGGGQPAGGTPPAPQPMEEMQP